MLYFSEVLELFYRSRTARRAIRIELGVPKGLLRSREPSYFWKWMIEAASISEPIPRKNGTMISRNKLA